MICWRRTLAAQTIPKAALTFESNLGVSHFSGKSPQALLSKGSLAATASRERRPSLSRHAPIASSSQGRNRSGYRSSRYGHDHLGQAFKPVATFVVTCAALAARWRLPAATVNELPLPCRTDRVSNLDGPSPIASLRPRADFYLWHSPTLAILKHLGDSRGCATKHTPRAPGTGRLSPASQELPSLVLDIDSQITSVGDCYIAALRKYVPAARRAAVSSRAKFG